jgi:hypothetical protein
MDPLRCLFLVGGLVKPLHKRLSYMNVGICGFFE